MRDLLYKKLKNFYRKHDPNKSERDIQSAVNYGLTEGLSALNAGLLKKYGDYLDSQTDANVVEHGAHDKNFLRGRLELFYFKYDPSKLDKPEDIESVLDWVLLYSVEKLNEKLLSKYGEDLYAPTAEDAQAQLKKYYSKVQVHKSDKDIAELVQWGMEYSFCLLNQSMIKKYNVGFGELDLKSLKTDLKVKLGNFYAVYDKTQLDDPDNIDHMIQWSIKYGVDKLNIKLHKKYGASLNTVLPHPPDGQPPEDAEIVEEHPEPRERVESVVSEMAAAAANMNDEEIDLEVSADEENIKRLRTLAHYFYAKYDQDKLYDGGVSALVDTAILRGEEALNEKLRGKYNADLIDVEEEFDIIEEKLEMFYKLYDPERLETSIDSIIGWTIVHGEGALNDKLMLKYDDDLVSTGLKIRLRKFYRKVGERKSDIDISNIANWAFRKGIHRLNKRMKKKYGMNLEDMFYQEEPDADAEEYEEEYEEELDGSGGEGYDDDDYSYENNNGGSYADVVEAENSVDRFLEDSPSEAEDSYIGEDLVSEYADEYDNSMVTAVEAVEEEEEDPMATSMVTKLQKFYARHDPIKGSNGKVVRANIEYILNNGVEAFNRILIEKYGESLNSLLGRKKTLAKFKKAKEQKTHSKKASLEDAHAQLHSVL